MTKGMSSEFKILRYEVPAGEEQEQVEAKESG